MPRRDSGAASDSSWTGCGDWCDTTTQDAASQTVVNGGHWFLLLLKSPREASAVPAGLRPAVTMPAVETVALRKSVS